MYSYQLENCRCTFTFDEPAEKLCRSIFATKYLSGANMTSDYKKLSFHASHAEPLLSFVNRQSNKSSSFTYHRAILLIKYIGSQLFQLEKQNASLLWMDIEHIFVINKQFMFYFGNEHVADIDQETKKINFCILEHMSNHPFAAPEFKMIKTIPATVPHQAPYYSLGAITSYCLFGDIDPQNISPDIFGPIVDTKLYWFLLRAIEINPNKRNYLFV